MQSEQATGLSDEHIHYLDSGIGIHQHMLKPWETLVATAAQRDIELVIASGYRSFERQCSIWNRKFCGELKTLDINNQAINMEGLSETEKVKAILLYSALPGASRHHWGTDIDVYSPSMLAENQTLQLAPWEYESDGPFYLLFRWLKNHAKDLGFYFPYLQYNNGVAPEPWHISYYPLSKSYQETLTLELLEQKISQSDILGKDSILKMLPTIFTQYINNISEFS